MTPDWADEIAKELKNLWLTRNFFPTNLVAAALRKVRADTLDEAYMVWKDNYADAGENILALKDKQP